MKKTTFMPRREILALAMALATLSASAQSKYTIICNVGKEFDGQTAYITDYETNVEMNSELVKKGKAVFKGETEGDKPVEFNLGDKNFVFVLEAGKIKINAEQETATGTPMNDAAARFKAATDSIHQSFKAKRKALAEDSSVVDKMEMIVQLQDENEQAVTDLVLKTLRDNPDNSLGIIAMREMNDSEREPFEETLKLCGDRVCQSREVKQTILRFEQEDAMMGGAQFTDINFPTGSADGTEIRLSDYIGRGKFILLDFSASWCAPCRAEIPNLKLIHDTYHGDRFEILTVAVDDKREEMQKLIARYRIPWPTIFDATFEAVQTYGSNGIPLIILFSPEGKVIGYNLRGEAILQAVEKALGVPRKSFTEN